METPGNEKQPLGNQNKPKQAINYSCKLCDYNTYKINNFNVHLTTRKHTINVIRKQNGNNGNQNSQKLAGNHSCVKCDKKFFNRSGLWKHKKICHIDKTNQNLIVSDNTFSDVNDEENTVEEYENYNDSDEDNKMEKINMNATDKELIIMLIKQNAELIEIVKNTSGNNTLINNTNNGVNNSHNKTFNLNVFLNEYCKDAMNIMDFVDSLQLQLSDLENVGKLGYVEGISNIIVKNLKALDVCKRPVHCSDSKREVIYVKDNDKWERENDDKFRIRKAIKYIAHKNTKLIIDFREKYPDCNKSHSKYADQYNKLVVEAMGGFGDNDVEKEDKIIKNIVKEVTINKKQNYIE